MKKTGLGILMAVVVGFTGIGNSVYASQNENNDFTTLGTVLEKLLSDERFAGLNSIFKRADKKEEGQSSEQGNVSDEIIFNENNPEDRAETNEGNLDQDLSEKDREIFELENEKYILLVNKKNLLDRSYGPESTINLANHVKATKSEILMDEEAGEKYIEMINAMKADGITDLAAVSGYRSYDYQSGLHNNQINRYIGFMSYAEASRRAGRIVAPPGASEHQTGLAVDVSSASVGYSLSENFENTEAYRWLSAHAYQYGYIIRYTREKTDITDIIYEPWHIRYVGSYHAEQMYTLGLCLEEYLETIEN